jgi:hypothetical protein
MTLIEVLISMFVLLIGLLGVGTICQLGRLTLVETAKFDRAAACGRAALRQVRIGRMLDVTNWRDINGNQIVPYTAGVPNYNASAATNGYSSSFDSAGSYCIDPVMIGQVAATGSPTNLSYIDRFPALYPPVQPPSRHQRSMKRVTLGVAPLGTAFSQTMPPYCTSSSLYSYAPVASRMFMWRDDLAYDTSNVPKLRPQRIYRNIAGLIQAGYAGNMPGNILLSAGTPLFSETDVSAQGGGGAGGYSWMVTVTPAYQEMPLQSGANAGALAWTDHHLFNVSVVVFYKRNLLLPLCSNGQVQSASGLPYDQSECSERIVYATFVNPPPANATAAPGAPAVSNPTGYGGGDVILTAPSSAKSFGDMLSVKRDDWILLLCEANMYVCPDVNPSLGTSLNQPAVYFKWYRVVAVDDSNISIGAYPNSRRVTLAGPDFPAPNLWNPPAPANNPTSKNVGVLSGDGAPVEAVLMSGVVGVYSDVITLESNRLWAPAP